MLPNPYVANLNFYPIKSCAGVGAEQVALTELGIEYDREWMIVGSNGQFLSQRVHPELALVKPRIDDGQLVVAAPRMGELAISLERDTDAEVVPVNVWKKPGTATIEGAEAAAYLSDYLHRNARLLRILQPRQIRTDCQIPGASNQTGFADGFPILLTADSSLAELNTHLDTPITMDRFRPNITIDGGRPYDEDFMRKLKIGNITMYVVRACARCPIPNVDQAVGTLPRERLVTAALRATRYGIDTLSGTDGEFFGQNLVHEYQPGATIKVGDAVTTLESSPAKNWLALKHTSG